MMQKRYAILPVCLALFVLLSGTIFFGGWTAQVSPARAFAAESLPLAFDQAAQEFGVPSSILKAICYMEGRLSNHGGSPSIDNGYGCMHLVKNSRGDTLDRAASALGVSIEQLKQDMPTTIRGGAVILRDDALQLSQTHRLPDGLAEWYGAIAAYSNATTRSTALLYADGVYTLQNHGFVAQAETGETITLTPQLVVPDTATAATIKGSSNLPSGCSNDHKVDYPGAIDCILNPNIYGCNVVPPGNPCTYQSANRPYDYTIEQVVIHDIEGTAQDALNVFQDVNSGVSVHYIVDSDGTIYQVVHAKDIAYHAGNFWYNEHSVGIEHAGFDATSWQWYNATEYLAQPN